MKNSRVKILNAFFVFSVFFQSLFFISCQNDEILISQSVENYKNGITVRSEGLNAFSVNFLSVGQGDSAFIILPDGKTVLIDCGEKSEINLNTISMYNDAAGGNAIDYLVLSHTDSDHTGSAADIIKKYGVKTAYVPKVIDDTGYTAYRRAKEELDVCGATVKVSAIGERIIGEDYFFCFLYPSEDLDYDDINFGNATAGAINAVSSILYLDYRGTRFIFTGDADKKSEEKVVERAKDGFYYIYGKNGFNVNLENIDFLKVSHHGGKEEISEKFYEYLKPKNAVISVGALNNYGHPSSFTIQALSVINPEIEILRTDVLGSISVNLVNTDNYKIITDAD